MRKDSITGKNYSITKVIVTLTEGKSQIILSDKSSQREVVNDIFDYIESENKCGRIKGSIIDIRFLDNQVIELE